MLERLCKQGTINKDCLYTLSPLSRLPHQRTADPSKKGQASYLLYAMPRVCKYE